MGRGKVICFYGYKKIINNSFEEFKLCPRVSSKPTADHRTEPIEWGSSYLQPRTDAGAIEPHCSANTHTRLHLELDA